MRTEPPSVGLKGVLFLKNFFPQQKLISMAILFTIHGDLAAVAEIDQATFNFYQYVNSGGNFFLTLLQYILLLTT